MSVKISQKKKLIFKKNVALNDDTVCQPHRQKERRKNRLVAIPKRGLTDRGLYRLLRPVRHCQPSNNALSLRRESAKQQKASPDWGKLGKGESLGSRGGQSVNAEAGLHTRTGHLLPRTVKFPDARDTTEGGGGGNWA